MSNKIDWTTIGYSTEEQVVGTWINGKPLYRKIVEFGALPDSAGKEVNLSIGGQYSRIVKIDAYMTKDTPMTSYARPIPYNDGTNMINFYWSEYICRISTNSSSFTQFNANIFVYYWKTTD